MGVAGRAPVVAGPLGVRAWDFEVRCPNVNAEAPYSLAVDQAPP